MGSPLMTRDFAVLPLTPAADYSAKAGYLGTFSGETFTVSASATTPATGVILEGAATTGQVSVGILGNLAGSCRMKAGGSITKGDWVQQHTDGRVVTDAGSGGRVIVGVALEGGVANDLIEIAPVTPTPKS